VTPITSALRGFVPTWLQASWNNCRPSGSRVAWRASTFAAPSAILWKAESLPLGNARAAYVFVWSVKQ
jgi:hypothetical protein